MSVPTFERFEAPGQRPALGSASPVEDIPDGYVGAATFDVLRPLGLTYRRLDYWTRIGVLECDPDSDRGSGYRRIWPETEVGIAAAMLRLLDAGISHNVARGVARQGPPTGPLGAGPAVHELADGLTLVADPALWSGPA